MRVSNKLVCGIGIKGIKYPARLGKKSLKEYDLWKNMLRRCTQKYQDVNPTYIGVTCSENFKSYEYFYEWCQTQTGFGNISCDMKSWHLDKDLLVKGNKLYGEDTCCFIPSEINVFFTKRKALRGGCHLGVNWDKDRCKFRSQCNDGTGKRVYLGLFRKEEDAFNAYKIFKENLLKCLAEKYRQQLSVYAYNALIGYEVDIKD